MDVKGPLRAVDAYQRGHRWLGFPLAVLKKFGDDQAGNLAALIAYYAFFSLFPLLLVLVTVLGLLLRHDAALQQRVLSSALANFPVIGDQLKTNVHSLNRTGIGLAVGIVGTFIGARGVANAAQNALNAIWEVPYKDRPGFPMNLLRSVAMIGVVGLGVAGTTVLSSLGGGTHHTAVGLRVVLLAVALGVNVLLFWLGFRLATASDVTWRELFLGAAIAAAVWQLLQVIGSYFVARTLKNSTPVYGVFGLVIGLLSWLYLQAQLTLYAAEVDVVKHRRLWPRALVPPPLTEADERAYRAYTQVEERRRPQQATLDVNEPVIDSRGVEASNGKEPVAGEAAADITSPAAKHDAGGARHGSVHRQLGIGRVMPWLLRILLFGVLRRIIRSRRRR